MTPRGWALCALLLVACGDDGEDGSPTDAGMSEDGGATVDGGVDAGTGGDITCSDTTCALGEEVCCAMPGPPTTFACVESAGACSGGVAECDGPEDCGTSDACCIRFAGGALPASACEAASGCIGAGTSVACGTVDDCPDGQVCCVDETTGYSAGFCWPTACP